MATCSCLPKIEGLTGHRTFGAKIGKVLGKPGWACPPVGDRTRNVADSRYAGECLSVLHRQTKQPWASLTLHIHVCEMGLASDWRGPEDSNSSRM